MTRTAQDTQRDAQVAAFLRRAGWEAAERAPLAGDASNRRYDRLRHADHGAAVLMDAPPERGEDIRPFAALTFLLRGRGFSAPEIYAGDESEGFLLLEDLGDDLFAAVTRQRPAVEAELYEQAIDLLVDLHGQPAPEAAEGMGVVLPLDPYDGAVLRREAALLTEWYLPGALGAPTPPDLAAEFDALVDAACAGVANSRETLVLRDYHAENLIWRPERAGAQRVGLLDYQDALVGHPAYDLVSLLEDARRDVAAPLSEAMLARYLDRSGREAEPFYAAYAALGAQRNLKIIGIFARLWLRDGKDRYLAHIPRVWRHLERDLAHPAMAELRAWIAKHAPAPEPAVLASLRARGAS